MIRLAQNSDLEGIVTIYNHAIEARFQTGFTEAINTEDRQKWFDEHSPLTHPLYVYEVNGMVAGWLSISPYRSGRAALRFTAEVSYFIHTDHRQQGIGNALLQHAIASCGELNIKTLLAIIIDRNEASIQLVKKYGFEQWAYLPGVAVFDGVECSHVYYGLRVS